jgi:hypothetical protein
MAKVVEPLPSKCKALSSNSSTANNNNNIKWASDQNRHLSKKKNVQMGNKGAGGMAPITECLPN